ncbi:MAG: hypothetical protein QOF50_445 [Gaiellaceae bacterium]|jgi:hypothetical protein|nr:hypothetical protein [Gaiellaceae bacterium]
MRFLEQVDEDAVVSAFLRAELNSDRFKARLTQLAAGVNPFERDAAFRRELLRRHRSWGRNEGLFYGFPAEVDWHRVAATPDEVLAIRYINWDWWLRISDGTRDACVAAERIRQGLVPGGDPAQDERVAATLQSDEPPPELIALTPPERTPLVLVEGHVRLTAYAMSPEYLPAELELFVGVAERARDWSEF